MCVCVCVNICGEFDCISEKQQMEQKCKNILVGQQNFVGMHLGNLTESWSINQY